MLFYWIDVDNFNFYNFIVIELLSSSINSNLDGMNYLNTEHFLHLQIGLTFN